MKKDYKKQIAKIIKDLNKKRIDADKRRDKVIIKDKDSYFFLTGRESGLRLAISKLHKLRQLYI